MKFISKILIFFFLAEIALHQNVTAQSFNSFYGSVVNECSYDSVYDNLISFENLGVKEPGTTALNNTLSWLISKYQSYGYTDIVIDTFDYIGFEVYNLIVTKSGLIYPTTYVVVDGHYDTKTGTGTNDNGSGTAIILETARLLKNVNTEYAVKFIHFSMEEVGLVGSYHFVNNIAFPNGLDIRIVFNIDEVGGDNTKVNNTIVCERDQSNPSAANAQSYAFTDTLATCVQLYSNLLTEISYAYASDYMPFQAKDYVITGLFEKNETPHRHQATDSIAYVDVPYVFEITKGTVGATLYFAVAFDSATSIHTFENASVKIYPNPATDYVVIDFKEKTASLHKVKIVNILGEIILEEKLTDTKNLINVAGLKSGIYSLVIDAESNRLSTKVIIK